MRYFIVGAIIAIISFCMLYSGPEDMAKKKIENMAKINHPEITQLPSIDGCDIKHVKAYALRQAHLAIAPDLKKHEFYIAKCGNTQTTTNVQPGKTKVVIPTIVEVK